MDVRRIKIFFSQNPMWQLIIVSLVLPIIAAVVYVLLIPQTDKLLILHYSIPFGIDLVGEWQQILYIPFIGFIFAIINTLISFTVFVRYKSFALIVLIFTVFIQVVIASSVGLLISQNI